LQDFYNPQKYGCSYAISQRPGGQFAPESTGQFDRNRVVNLLRNQLSTISVFEWSTSAEYPHNYLIINEDSNPVWQQIYSLIV